MEAVLKAPLRITTPGPWRFRRDSAIHSPWLDGPAAIIVEADDVVIENLTLHGPGQKQDRNEFCGVRIAEGCSGVRMRNCVIEGFEYACVFAAGDDFALEDSRVWQDFAKFGKLDYAVVLAGDFFRISNCGIQGNRHAIIVGTNKGGGRRGIIEGCDLQATANVSTLAFKPGSSRCRVVNNTIIGGVNLGGTGQLIANNHLFARLDYPQPSSIIWASRDSCHDLRHLVTGNIMIATTNRGNRGNGLFSIERPRNNDDFGRLVISNNSIYLEGDAPLLWVDESNPNYTDAVDLISNTMV